MGMIDSALGTGDSEAARTRHADASVARYPASGSALATDDGAATTIHFPDGLRALEDREILVITVGQSAACSAVQAGIPCVGLPNAWAWSAGLHDQHDQEITDLEGLTPVPVLTDIARSYKRVLVLGGSEQIDDRGDRRGLELLSIALKREGIRAHLAFCPPAVVLQHGGRSVVPQTLGEWLSADSRTVKPNLAALFFAVEVYMSSGITDSFNAHTIADLFQTELAYSRGCWYMWDGRIWSQDSDEVRHKLVARVAGLYRANAERLQRLVSIAVGSLGNKEIPYPFFAWAGLIRGVISGAMKSAASIQNLRTMDAAFTIAQAYLRVPSDAWDRDPHLLSVHNGVVDLRTGELHPASPEFRMTRIAGCAYDPGAASPLFNKFLSEVQPNPDTRAYLQRLIGYAATGEAREQKFFTFLGDGANGKGTFIAVIMDALGDYAAKANAGLLAEQAPDKPRNDLAALAGARLVSISELPSNLRADAALIKSITGGDVVKARFLHKEFFDFRPCFTPILDTNHPLTFRESTEAVRRRSVTIPWPVTIRAGNRDPFLREKLLQELPGILAWIVEGARQYYATGLESPKLPTGGDCDRSMPIDPFAQWFEESIQPDAASRVQSSVLYRSYCEWLDVRGATAGLDIKAFGAKLVAMGFQEPEKSNGVMMWRGLRLRR